MKPYLHATPSDDARVRGTVAIYALVADAPSFPLLSLPLAVKGPSQDRLGELQLELDLLIVALLKSGLGIAQP